MKVRAMLTAAAVAIALGWASASVTAAPFDQDSCCSKAQGKGEVCKHPCCAEAAKDNKVCGKCNKEAGDSKEAYKADGCCGKAYKKGEACKHPCCAEAGKKGEVCEKCNK